MTRAILATDHRPAPALARLAAALLLLPHGAQHALGLLGGYGFAGTKAWMVSLGFPAALAALAIVVELVAPLALLLGLLGRPAALGLVGLMLGAITTHRSNGFFMNWFGQLKPGAEGFEYHLVMIALLGVVVVEGSGALSADAWLARRLGRSTASHSALEPALAAR